MNEEELIKKYEALIYKIAKKFYNVELADLYQAGVIGLIKAKRKYNPELNSDFMSFAYMHIFGEMYELVNKSMDIRLNKVYLKLYKNIQLAKSELLDKLNREPNIEEISKYTNYDESLISEVLMLTSSMLRIDAEYESMNGESFSIADTIGEYQNPDDRILIEDSLNTLEPIEQEVIKIRYFEDLTQMETAEVLGISQVKVSRIESKGKQKIKEYIAA